MSFAIDVNILVYASHQQSERHAAAIEFLESCVRGPEVFYLAWITVMSYLRLVTNPRILSDPLTPREAQQNIDALLTAPHCRLLSERDGFWHIYQTCVAGSAIRSNDVPDAHLAAVLKQNGITRLYTADRDFRRFDFLRVIDPFKV